MKVRNIVLAVFIGVILILFSACADFFSPFTAPMGKSERSSLYSALTLEQLIGKLRTVEGQQSVTRKAILELIAYRDFDSLLTLSSDDRSLLLQSIAGTAFELSSVASAYRALTIQDAPDAVLIEIFDKMDLTLDLNMIHSLVTDKNTQETAELQGLYLATFAGISTIMLSYSKLGYTEIMNGFLFALKDTESGEIGSKKAVDMLIANQIMSNTIPAADYNLLVDFLTALRKVDSTVRSEINSMMVGGNYVMNWLFQFYYLITGDVNK